MTYPIILMGISMLSIFVFVVYVLPMIEPMFKSLKVELPLPTRMLLGTRTILLPAAISAVSTIVALWVGRPWVKRFLQSHPNLRTRLSRIPLQIPVIGTVLEKIAVSRIL